MDRSGSFSSIGALVRRHGHFDACEDAVQEALPAATLQWPGESVPDNPRGWLITAASRRLTDELRSEYARTRRETLVATRTPADEFRSPAARAGYREAARRTTSLPEQRYLETRAARLAQAER
ncbi:hypothetical protein [Streptosporangium sp. CA-115845]|uniref:hypothetical protein n=1 Tax=Streptosporangium sp. CA-115845 TaxID=3240071 RepID=UPI003D8B047A